MGQSTQSYRTRLLLAGACLLVTFAGHDMMAQTATTAPTNSTPSRESITVKAKKRLIREKNAPSAVTELGEQQIQAAGVGASAASLLRQAPSVYVYQQGLGDNAPELTIRGVRGLEVASTLDGIPTQDLENPAGFYLSNNIGGVFTTNQISGVHLYPGIAYPSENTFGTIGGTIAYDSKRPTDDYYLDLTGEVGSHGTYMSGFELNSGSLDSPLGTGDDAAKLLLNYRNFQTLGYVENTQSRENEMEFAFDKPYDEGQSKFQATILFNTGDGLIESEPVPLDYLKIHGLYSNYPAYDDFIRQDNDWITVILKDSHYVNDYLNVAGTVFYLHNDNRQESYGNINLFQPGGAPDFLSVNGINPFVNVSAGFGYSDYLYGPPNPAPLGLFGGGTGGYYYNPKGGFTYNPAAIYAHNQKDCPASLIAAYGGIENTPCGLNDQIFGGSSDTYGVSPKAVITPPDIYGIENTIKIGGLAAKETTPNGFSYLGAEPGGSALSSAIFAGGSQRTIYQAFLQDKIDFIDNTLHITPGVTAEGTNSSSDGPFVFGSKKSPYYGPNGFENGGNDIDQYGPFAATRWDRDYLPFLNVSYDLDKIMPPLAGASFYGSTGQSALFAPVSDFGPNLAGAVPYASIVHLAEGGVKYNSSQFAMTLDYFYQKIDRDFGFFTYQSGPEQGESLYTNGGLREFKGVEANTQYQLTPEINLFGNASYTRAHYLASYTASDTVAEDQFGVAIRGAPNTGVPDWISTFGIDYTKKTLFLDNDDLHIRFSGNYTGHQYTSYDLPAGSTIPGVEGVCYTNCPLVPNPKHGQPGQPQFLSQALSDAYSQYTTFAGATVYDPAGGIAPHLTFGVDASYTLPTPQLPVLKSVTFDLNVANLFDTHYWQYLYKQISPGSCGTFTSGPFAGLQRSNYSCSPEYLDGIPGEPLDVFFTVKARF